MKTQGIGEVLAELERSHLEYPRSEHRPLLFAASEAAQRVYALVEGRYQDVGALPGHPATFRVTTVYHIFVLEAGGSFSVAAGSSAGSGASSVASVEGAGAAVEPCVTRMWLLRQLTEEDKDEVCAWGLLWGRGLVRVCSSWCGWAACVAVGAVGGLVCGKLCASGSRVSGAVRVFVGGAVPSVGWPLCFWEVCSFCRCWCFAVGP